jgi:hypothetical protein
VDGGRRAHEGQHSLAALGVLSVDEDVDVAADLAPFVADP